MNADPTSPLTVKDLLVSRGLVRSYSEAKRVITLGMVKLNGEVVTEILTPIDPGKDSDVELRYGRALKFEK